MRRQVQSPAERQDFGILINLAYGVFKQELEAHLATAGFDDLGSSFGYVFRLLEGQPTNLRRVADGLGITPQGALKLINEMVKKGYVERRDDPQDGRIKHLLLTSRARGVLVAARQFHAGFERELAGRIGAERAAAARLALEEIVMQGRTGAFQNPRPL